MDISSKIFYGIIIAIFSGGSIFALSGLIELYVFKKEPNEIDVGNMATPCLIGGIAIAFILVNIFL